MVFKKQHYDTFFLKLFLYPFHSARSYYLLHCYIFYLYFHLDCLQEKFSTLDRTTAFEISFVMIKVCTNFKK